MNLFVVSILYFSFASFTVVLVIFSKRQDFVGALWFVFNICCSLWALGYAYQINNDVPYSLALTMTRIGDSAAILIPALWLRFIYAFLDWKPRKIIFYPLYLISFLLLLEAPTTLFISGLKDKSSIGVLHFASGGPIFYLFTAMFGVVVALGFIQLCSVYLTKDISSETRKQIRFLIISAALGFGGGSAAFLPVYDIDIPVLYGAILAPLFPILMALAFSRYRLLDMDELIQIIKRDKLAAMGILTASIHHEIRSPLYVIRELAASHLEKQKDPAVFDGDAFIVKANEILGKILVQSDRVLDIVQRLSRFMKREIKQSFEMKSVSIREAVNEILPVLRHELETHHIHLKITMTAADLFVLADQGCLEEILFNLILNACHALQMKEHDRVIELTADKISAGSKIRIEIRDNGSGISKTDIPRIFQPFYTTKKEGTGLGLYLTKELTEKNAGTIHAESILGVQTKFILEFKGA